MFRLHGAPGDCLVCGAPNCTCKGSGTNSLHVQMTGNRSRSTMVSVSRFGGLGGFMADTKKNSTPADSGMIAPGESNRRAVRDGVRTREGSSGSRSKDSAESDLPQPVNRGE